MRQSQLGNGLKPLRLRDGGRQFARAHRIGEVLSLVRTVAERLIGGMAAAAERNGRAPSQAEGFAFLVFYLEIAFYFDWTIIKNSYFGCWQGILHRFHCKISITDVTGQSTNRAYLKKWP